jgi:transcriptional regulator with XRE-family HTH domain
MLKIKGIILKQKLQEKGIRLEDAAKELGVSRPTLTNWCSREKLGEDIISNVKSKLNIDLTEGVENDLTSNDVLPPIVQALIQSKDEMIKELKEDKEKLFNLLQLKGNQK